VANNPAVDEIWDSTISKLKDPVDLNLVREFQEATFGQPVPEAQAEALLEEPLKIPARVWKAVFKGMVMDDHSNELHKIKAPTLIVWGNQDDLTPRSEQEALINAIPGARLVVYEGIGHSPHWQIPERFASDLVKFIKSVIE